MRKEVLLAILFGFAIGLVITFGIYTANKSLKKNQTKEAFQVSPDRQEITPAPSPTPLTIYQPADNALLDDDVVTVEGKTFANAVVALTAEEDEYLITADESGGFSQDVDLIGGVNKIRIKSVGPDGQEAETVLNLVFSTAEIE